MSTNLEVTLIQSNLIWESPEENRVLFERKIVGITQEIDLIILPEMFTTGFSMTPKKLAESMNGDTVNWMKSISRQKEAAVVGSIIILEDDKYYNRLLFVHPNGTIDYYDKRHTFTLAGEDKEYTAGSEHLIVDYKGWKICPLICYDLRFPVWSRNTSNYELLIYVANWPTPRINAWDSLLTARAIENMTYCIGVNRVGVDANGYEYSGHSSVIDPLGKNITIVGADDEKIMFATLYKKKVQTVRDKLQFLNDQDTFVIQ